jgi:hypothetical protein
MNLQDYATLAEAKLAERITYRTIPTSESLQFFLAQGVEDILNNNLANTQQVDVGGTLITIGSICRGVLSNSTGFDLNPNTPMGMFNLGAIAILVGTGLLTQAIADAFIAKAQTTTYPLANKTEHDFQVAKGTITKMPVRITVNGESAIMSTTVECVSHAPRLTNAAGVKVGQFFNVSAVGEYVTVIDIKHRNEPLFVDDAYSVVA